MSARTTFTAALAAALFTAVLLCGIAYAGPVELREAVLDDMPDDSRDIQGTVWFQGYVADSGTGEPVNASYTVVARIYDADAGGATVWGPETHAATPINDGWFSVELGSIVSPLPAFDDPPYYLQLWIDGEVLAPRLKLASVPSAFQSCAADDGDDDWVISGSDVCRMSGSVGIGTASPGARLEVAAGSEYCAKFESSGTGSVFTVRGFNTAGTAAAFYSRMTPYLIPANATALFACAENGADAAFMRGSGTGRGMLATSQETGTALESHAYGTGRSGYFHGGSGVEIDGRLSVENSAFHGLSVTSDYASGNASVINAEFTASGSYHADAVRGVCVPAQDYGYGGYFIGGYTGVTGRVYPTGSNTYYGVYGIALGGSGSNVGVYGRGDGDYLAYGVYGISDYYAGYFSGHVRVTGWLTKGGGAFQIDHPLDPANKYLYHSFVESPDMMNVYNGNVVLDGAGEAWIEMPEWFEVLNRDFRYQLTCIGGFAPVYVAEKMSGGRFGIAGGEPGMEVSWQVTGIRQDRFAEENRIPVEEMKPPHERGTYLHPEVFGLPETKSVDYEMRSKDKE